MLRDVESVLHRIEALAGDGRYAVTFRRPDGSEQTAVVEVGDAVSVAESSLPPGWTRDGDAFLATSDALRAIQRARTTGPRTHALHDVEGGWDVMLGNVVLGASGSPHCTAHAEMNEQAGVWVCAQCEARALLG